MEKKNNGVADSLIGKKVLVRSNDAGVYFGTLEEMYGDTVRVTNVRNIWHWTGATCLSQIANDGITGDKVSSVVSSMVLTRVCQVIPLTQKAIDNLEKQPIWNY
jgi:hypothetical protein